MNSDKSFVGMKVTIIKEYTNREWKIPTKIPSGKYAIISTPDKYGRVYIENEHGDEYRINARWLDSEESKCQK